MPNLKIIHFLYVQLIGVLHKVLYVTVCFLYIFQNTTFLTPINTETQKMTVFSKTLSWIEDKSCFSANNSDHVHIDV